MISFCLAVWIYTGISSLKKCLLANIRWKNPQTRGQGYKGQTGVISSLHSASWQLNLYSSMMFTPHPVASTKTSQDKIREWSAKSHSVGPYSEYRIMSTASLQVKHQNSLSLQQNSENIYATFQTRKAPNFKSVSSQ